MDQQPYQRPASAATAQDLIGRRRLQAVLGRPCVFQIVNCFDPRNTVAISTAPALRR